MEEMSVQKKVHELKEYFQNHEFEKAEGLFFELLEKYPNYNTPVILYTQLFSVIEHDNPMYNRVMDLTRRFSLWDQYPEHLVPLWYTKIRPRNILLKSADSETEIKAAESVVMPDLGDLSIEDEVLNLPDSVPAVEEVAEEPVALVNPEELIPSDMEIEIAEEPVAEDFSSGDELDSLLPNMTETVEEPEVKAEVYDTNKLFDDMEQPLLDSANEIDELDALTNLHSDDNFMEPESDEEATHPDDEILVASETMAEIFIQQKKYKQAIKVYRILMEDDAENFDYFFKKVQELEQLKGQ